MRAAPHAGPERLGEAVQRPLREPERLQAFVGETDIDGETCPMLLLPRIDAFEHIAQPGARLRTIVKLEEDMPPVTHQDRRDDIVLNVVQIIFEVSGCERPRRRRASMVLILQSKHLAVDGSGSPEMKHQGDPAAEMSGELGCLHRIRKLFHAVAHVLVLPLTGDFRVDRGGAQHRLVRLWRAP